MDQITRRGALNLRRSYNFIDKHPVVDEVRTLMAQYRLSATGLAYRANLCPLTIKKWLDGTTVKPNSHSLQKVARVFGCRLGFVKGS